MPQQRIDDRFTTRPLEEFGNLMTKCGTHVRCRGQLCCGGAADRRERHEFVRELPCGRRTDAWNAQREEEARELDLSPGPDRRRETSLGDSAEARQRAQIVVRKGEQVCHGSNEPAIHEKLHSARAEAIDVERSA